MPTPTENAIADALKDFPAITAIVSRETSKAEVLLTTRENKSKLLILPIKIGAIIDAARQLISDNNTQQRFRLGEMTFVPETQKLIKKDHSEELLTQKEVAILLSLIDGGDTGQNKTHLMENVWEQRADLETHTIETHIYRLRQKLEADPNEPKILLTQPNGYKLIFYKD